MPVCEIRVKLEGSEETITLKDAEIIKKCPLLQRAIEIQNPDWKTTDTIVEEPVSIPFPKTAGDFFFNYVGKYEPSKDDVFDMKVEDYPEADAKNLDELKDIIELANYVESNEFMDCVAFVIAKKLDKLSVEEIAKYMVQDFQPDPKAFENDKDAWMYPPAEIFEK